MTILEISISASALILAITVLRAVMLNRLPKKAFLVLWGVALFRLLIPFNLPSKLSVFTLIGKMLRFAAPQGASVQNIGGGEALYSNINGLANAAGQHTISPFLVVWLIGMLATAVFFILSHLRCRQGYQMALPVDHQIVMDWQREHTTIRTVQIKQSDKITAPLTYGILHPIVLLPKTTDYADTRQLQFVLAHEYTHIKRFDILMKWVLAASLCIHWFNPLVWVLYILANRDIERACDETVVKTFGETEKLSYALTLISLEEKKSKFTFLCGNFSKNAVEERITSIMKITKTTALTIVVALALVVGTTTVFATSAAKTSDRIKPTYATMTTDENYVPKPHIYTSDTITLGANKATGEHDIPLDGAAVYQGEDKQGIAFSEGEAETICLKIVDRKFEYGQGVNIGYILDDTRVQLFDGQIKRECAVNFTAPKDGEYMFYIECASSDPLLVEKVSIG